MTNRTFVMDIAGRWSTSTGVLVFLGAPDTGYAYRELNTLGSVVGEGKARLVGTRVDIRGNNLFAGPIAGVFALAEDGKALRGVFTAEKFGPDGTSSAVELIRVDIPKEELESTAFADGRETYVGYMVLIGRTREYALGAWGRLTPAERAEWARATAAVEAEEKAKQ